MSFSEKIAEAVVRAASTMAARAAQPAERTVSATYAGTDAQGRHCVVLPGSDTAVALHSMAVEAAEGDRVTVTIRDGVATGTANLSNPSAGVEGVRKASEAAGAAGAAVVSLRRYTDRRTDAAARAAGAADRKADSAQKSADDAQGAADNAQKSADDAKTAADDAAKTATNYITESEAGIDIAVSTDSTTRQRMSATGTDFYVGGKLAHRINAAGNKLYQAGTEVASFGANLVELGKNATSAVISFCNGKGTIEYNADDSEPSSSDYGASTNYFEVKGADLRLRGTSRAALYSHYSNGARIGQKTSVITKPKQLYAFSQESTNLVNGEGTWTTSEMLMDPVSVAFLTETFTLNGINVRNASGLFDRGTLPVARGGTGKTSGTFYGATRIYSGTATCATFTLTSSVANYTWLTIQYRGNDGYYTTTTVFNNKAALNVALSVIESTVNGTINAKRVTYTFSGTSATVKTYGEADMSNDGVTTYSSKNVTVTGVWGWV